MRAVLTVTCALVVLLGGSGASTGVPAAEARPHTAVVPVGVPVGLIGRNLDRVPTRAKVVALTFDGGGDAAGVDRILAALAAAKVPATFFLTGRWAKAYPRQARRIAARYPVANHTETHPDMTRLSATAAARQVRTAARSIAAVIGRPPVALFRFPFGAFRASTIRVVNAAGYACIGWTVDTLGWKGSTGGMSASKVAARVLRTAVPGQIVLMHLGSHPGDHTTLDAAALPAIIAGLRARGYRFVTLPASLGMAKT